MLWDWDQLCGRKKKGWLCPAMDMVKVEMLANNIVYIDCVVIQIT